MYLEYIYIVECVPWCYKLDFVIQSLNFLPIGVKNLFICRVGNANRLLNECGTNVLLLEYRGYGLSGGVISETG